MSIERALDPVAVGVGVGVLVGTLVGGTWTGDCVGVGVPVAIGVAVGVGPPTNNAGRRSGSCRAVWAKAMCCPNVLTVSTMARRAASSGMLEAAADSLLASLGMSVR